MTIPEAVQLILHAGAQGGRGEVYVLDMGQPVRILDLAQDLIRLSGLTPDVDIPIHITGRRSGEKVSETLLTSREAECAVNGAHYCVAPPEPVELDALLQAVDGLVAAALRFDRAAILQALEDIVPAFCITEEDRLRHLREDEPDVAAEVEAQMQTPGKQETGTETGTSVAAS